VWAPTSTIRAGSSNDHPSDPVEGPVDERLRSRCRGTCAAACLGGTPPPSPARAGVDGPSFRGGQYRGAGRPPGRAGQAVCSLTCPFPAVNTPTTILVVDDEEAVRRLVVYPFERDGYRVLQAATGEEALRADRARAPRSDPARSSCCRASTATRCAGGYGATSMVPIIMLTARRRRDRQGCSDSSLGADDLRDESRSRWPSCARRGACRSAALGAGAGSRRTRASRLVQRRRRARPSARRTCEVPPVSAWS